MSRRKIILNLCTSLDFFIEGTNGKIDWCFTDQDYSMTEFLERIDTIIFGRKSYEQLVREMPDAFSEKKKIVFSKTLGKIDANANSIIISGNIEDEVNELINKPGKDIWLFGGASFATSLLKQNLIDELMISVHPLILGKGKPLFNEIDDRKKLKLTEVKTFSTGLVQLYYKIEKE